jgi:hypothetical protein
MTKIGNTYLIRKNTAPIKIRYFKTVKAVVKRVNLSISVTNKRTP